MDIKYLPGENIMIRDQDLAQVLRVKSYMVSDGFETHLEETVKFEK